MTIEEIKHGETDTLEFKREFPTKDTKLMKTVAAFSNCHGGRIIFGVDDETLEITSPGGLYGGLTIEQMLKGSSSIRNELVADIFLKMGIVEKWGTGIKRMHSA
ncbi:MAG: putative DNA binding domain-containing protein [Treponema sp.]|nr:putative DNA binding domain-containing protein [Treponema sp.]